MANLEAEGCVFRARLGGGLGEGGQPWRDFLCRVVGRVALECITGHCRRVWNRGPASCSPWTVSVETLLAQKGLPSRRGTDATSPFRLPAGTGLRL